MHSVQPESEVSMEVNLNVGKSGKFELSKEELESLCNRAYYEGYRAGYHELAGHELEQSKFVGAVTVAVRK